MTPLADLGLPAELRIASAERNTVGETNDVFFCTGEFQGRPVSAYIKAAKRPNLNLANERSVLDRLAATDMPVPRVLWYGNAAREVLVVEAVPGAIIWDCIDPRRGSFLESTRLAYLRAYGECLGRIHALPIEWPPQKRSRLCGLIGEEAVDDGRFQRLVSWLRAHPTACGEPVFVHGDFNTASVLVRDGAVSGVVDWEFSGRGWREYDIAWALRARTAFLNTEAEREAFLEGYRVRSPFYCAALRWCEVLNYLHFAAWTREVEPEYSTFALRRAEELTEF